jgi:hypothetical protein
LCRGRSARRQPERVTKAEEAFEEVLVRQEVLAIGEVLAMEEVLAMREVLAMGERRR